MIFLPSFVNQNVIISTNTASIYTAYPHFIDGIIGTSVLNNLLENVDLVNSRNKL